MFLLPSVVFPYFTILFQNPDGAFQIFLFYIFQQIRVNFFDYLLSFLTIFSMIGDYPDPVKAPVEIPVKITIFQS